MSPPAPGPPVTRPPALDGGWGWAVVACSFLALLLGYGSPQTVGVLYPEWLLAFGEGKAKTACVGSVVTGVGLVVGPVCSLCVVNFGARPIAVFSGVMVAGGLILSAFAPNVPFLIFSYGLVVGVGIGLLYAATVTITCLYFDRRRGLALGIMSTGTSAGGFLYATLQTELIELFGLEGCLLIVGALALNVVACAGPMRPLTPPKYYLKKRATILEQAAEDQQQYVEEEEGPSNRKPTANDPVITMETKEPMDRVLMAMCVSLFLFSLGHFPPQLFLEDVAQSAGLSGGVASVSLVSLASVGAGLGKLGLGVMADLPRVDSVFLYALTVGVAGMGVLLIPLASSYQELQVLSLVLGLLSGNWTLTPYVTAQLVGVEKLAEAHGVLMFFGGVALMLGPPVVGSFYDLTQSYDLAFYLSGGCTMTGGLILFVAAVLTPTEAPPPPDTELIS
ncbi:monocarboxylate transporter 9-like [Symphorus nematophorus]